MPVIIAVIAVAVLIGGFFLYKRTVPSRPGDAHTAAEGFRASVEKYRAEHPEAAQAAPNPQALQRRMRLGSKDRRD